ncbi:hypothetical protein DSO57_1017827 [Entomophthora muscae]|uniref:Uncharacterized protein n=1 Tax=Entomophthora muscae TaxID=34485 RepID=A0ACC2SH59_9FUNG|nr:hypothetical protein DSO57_1017827 [Entomophthora muscae]
MHFSIALTLAVTRVLAQSPSFTFEPTTVVAGELTRIKITHAKEISCESLSNKIKLVIAGASNRSFIASQEESFFNTHSEKLEAFPDYFFVKTQQNLVAFLSSIDSHFSIGASYLSLDPTDTSIEKPYEVTLLCGSDINNEFTPAGKPLLTEKLDITVIAAPVLPKVVKLTPSEANSTLVSTIVLNAPWPKECRTEKQPVVKLFLDAETIRDGGALFSDPQPGYYVYGLKGNTSQVISAIKTNKTIKEDKFTAIEFQRYSYALHNQLNLTFKFLGQQVPSATAKDTPLKVEFTCGNRVVKFYSNETDNAPIIKVNHAIPASIAIPTFLLSFLVFLV